MAKSKREKKKTKKADDAPPTTTRAPNIEWVKNQQWTWVLVTYLTDHPIFRKKLFSDSTAEANKEGRKKAVAQDGRPQQWGVIAKHIFENDPTQSALYAANPARFVTSVETRLRRLKTDYVKYCQLIGATGAGLDPSEVTPDSELANLIGKVTAEWPWWKEFHGFWRELPNYNPVAVESSTPGVDHAAEATALFEIPGGEDEGGEDDEGSDKGADDEGQNDEAGEEQFDDEENAPKDNAIGPSQGDSVTSRPSPSQARGPSPKPTTLVNKVAPTPKVLPKPSKVKAILGGRDAGLAKANTTKSTPTAKNAIDRFNETRQQESERLDRKREREHEFRMEQARNKRLKYELKYGGQAKAAEEERAARREELQLQLEIARLNAQASQPPIPPMTPPTPPTATSTSRALPSTPAPRPVFRDFNARTPFGEGDAVVASKVTSPYVFDLSSACESSSSMSYNPAGGSSSPCGEKENLMAGGFDHIDTSFNTGSGQIYYDFNHV